MSKQNKNVKNRAKAAVITAMHLRGEKGAAKTVATHGKALENRLYTSRTRGLKDKKPVKKTVPGL